MVGAPIENTFASIYLKLDSSLITTQISDKKGIVTFTVEPQPIFVIFDKDSFVTRAINLDSVSKNNDTIFLQKKDAQSETVTVYASPIIIKEDTIQFNNALFKNDSLKTLEEVLKKFPGVTVDREGNIEINGQKITEILLEGKPLPLNDIKQLTQTLEAGLIDKIQFIDKKSEQQNISKIEDGQRTKVINIKLKSKTKRSINHDYSIGVGNNKRLESRANTSILYNDYYLNSWVRYSNTGRNEFSNINYFNPNGLNTGFNGNTNIRYAGFKKWTIGAYFTFNIQETKFEEYRDRVIFLKDSLNYYTQNLNSTVNNNSINTTIYTKFIPDTLGEFNSTTSFIIANNKNNRFEDFNTLNNSKIKLNQGIKQNNGNGNRFNVNVALNGGQRNKKNTHSYYATLNVSTGNNEDETFQKNNVLFFRTTGLVYDTTRQNINSNAKNFSVNTNINFFKKITKTLRIKFGTGYQYSNRPIYKDAFFYNYTTGLYNLPNTPIFNDARNTNNVLNQNVGLVWEVAKIHNLSAGISYNQQFNKNLDNIKDTLLQLNTRFYSPYFSYVFYNKIVNINTNINFLQRPPTTQQLLPIVDNSNPLYIRKGNPLLKNEQTITIVSEIKKQPNRKQVQNKNVLTYTLTNNTILTQNRIANNTVFDPTDGKQVISPVNLPKAINSSTNFYVNKYFEKTKFNINSRINFTYQKDNNFLNSVLNQLKIFSVRPSIGVKYIHKVIEADYNIGYLLQNNTYSLRPTQNIKIGSFTNDASITLIPAKKWNISLDYQQTINNNGRSIQRVNNLNGRINFIPKWKKPKTTFSFQAFDILNQNTNIRQIINDYYEEYITTNAVRRFVLFSAFIKFNSFKVGKKKPLPNIKKLIPKQ